jgi:serine/threonine protein kinase
MRRAWDAVLQRDVAVLTPCEQAPGPAGRERFQCDVAAFARLDHPALPRVFDGGVEDGRPYLVVELIRGETLAELCRREPLDPAGITELGLTLTGVLEHVRGRGAGYVGVTPDTVLVEEDGRVRLSGIGVVSAPDGDEGPLVPALRELLGAVAVTETAENRVRAAPETRPEGWAAAAGLVRRVHSRRRAVSVTAAAAALGAAFLLAPMLPTGGDANRGGSGAAAVIGPTPEPDAAATEAAPTTTAVPAADRPAAEPRDRKGPAEPKGKDEDKGKGKAETKGKKKPKSP